MLEGKQLKTAVLEAADKAGLLVAAALAIACLGLVLAGAALLVAVRRSS